MRFIRISKVEVYLEILYGKGDTFRTLAYRKLTIFLLFIARKNFFGAGASASAGSGHLVDRTTPQGL